MPFVNNVIIMINKIIINMDGTKTARCALPIPVPKVPKRTPVKRSSVSLNLDKKGGKEKGGKEALALRCRAFLRHQLQLQWHQISFRTGNIPP
jgi:hypothetical protein